MRRSTRSTKGIPRPGCRPDAIRKRQNSAKTAVSWTISRLTRGLSANANVLCRPRRRLALFCSLSLEHTFAEKILSERRAGSTATRSRRRRRMHPISLNTRPATRDRLPALPDATILRPCDLRCHRRSGPPAGDPFSVQSRGSQTLTGTILHRGRRSPRHVERRAAREPDEGPARVRNPPRRRQNREPPTRMRHVCRSRSE